jgi:hypothetical protein
MQLSTSDNHGPAPSATSLVLILVVCALLLFVALP